MRTFEKGMFNEQHAKLAKECGVEYVGTYNGLFYFNVMSGSTLTLSTDGLTKEEIGKKVEKNKESVKLLRGGA